MASNIDKLTDDLLRFTAFIQDSMDERAAQQIGNAITGEMLKLIARGISPIEGAGRFPGYKWAEVRNALRKERTAINKELRKVRRNLFVYRRKNKRQFLAMVKKRNREALAGVTGRYPFTAQAKRLGKKPRPVNLFLTGDFLSNLEYIVTGTAGKYGIELGFFDELSAKKESGHREGVNGQPKRPIIPVGREDFAISIQKIIFRKMEELIDRAASRAS